MEPSPACNLPPGDYRKRLAWIGELNSSALREYRRADREVELRYDASAVDQVREFVRRERECCPLLVFTVREDRDAVVVRIEVPEDLSRSADELFAPYTRS
ncbi:hypothetical protein BST23_19480 [Mycolicibacterium elephantis]|uniref:Uncharacterized protein n=1 Tax=Mycolicibacterium elephantis TaxID=81858 RepID=A0A0M2ZKW5_9MYCO|nr:hypothetical protein [Mycolicibacterium elephantis]KKW64830.1 hypothetical protein AAV95_09820 [Mycolicibacterium elephantis]OBA90559.1 hypothetical protein A5633_04920 [Mycolicibacterium elephantis]ORA62895.1 hypothetical protein BST23_19480 [Mycolicibacterium elephantis]